MALEFVALLLSGFALALAVAFLIISTWYDAHQTTTQFFTIFLVMMIGWNSGYFLGQIGQIADPSDAIIRLAYGLMQFGSVGVGLSVYILLSSLTKIFPERLKWPAFISIMFVITFNIFSGLNTAGIKATQLSGHPFFVLFNMLSLMVAWRYRRKVRQQRVLAYLAAVAVGHSLAMLNPGLQSLGLIVANAAALLTSVTLTREALIVPLMESKSQLETMHDVSLTISSQLSPDVVLREIAEGARRWLEADAVALFRNREQFLELMALDNLPASMLKVRVALDQTLVGSVATSKQAIWLEDYSRQWHQEADLPLARETFGSVIGAPLVYHDTVIGALLVIRSKQGRIFVREDARQLELFSAQAAVAISNGELFQEQMELDRIKSEMIRMTSHDLKNPLQAALANLDLLSDDLRAEMRTNSEIGLSIQNIYKQMDRMTRIISGILDIERARMGVHLNEVCEPGQLVRAAMDELAAIARDRSIGLGLQLADDVPHFIGDKAQFQRALVNLIENAIKFSLEGGKVSIMVDHQAGMLMFRVIDEGIGIPDDILDRIFERFFRGQQPGAEHVSGSGLGLSLVKTVVESHHGRIWVEKVHPHGSAFIISLPVPQTTLVKE